MTENKADPELVPTVEKNGDYQTVPSYFISRKVMYAEQAQRLSGYERDSPSYMQSVQKTVKKISFSSILHLLVPVTLWLPKYNCRRDLFGDISSGITVAVMHIPQGMAYGILASVPPQVGLYMAFFPVLCYFIFGTSRHISMGTFAVISLMITKTVQTHGVAHGESPSLGGSGNGTLFTDESGVVEYSALQVVTAVSMMVGLYQLIMCACRMGALSSLLSEPLVSGFTTAAAVHVLVSQIKDLLGVRIPRHKGAFKVIYSLRDIITVLPNGCNSTAILVSAIMIIMMVVVNELIKPWMAKKCRFPIPVELIAVVGGTSLSYLLGLGPNYNVILVGHIPTGLPTPSVPPFELLRLVAIDSIAIAIVSYSIVMSMALIFAKKHAYEVKANQELLAMGLSNITGSLFSCIPIACSLSRSLIQEKTGGQTQIASVISAGLILVVLLWIGPFFESLPRCVLGAVIVVALKGMFLQFKDLKRFYHEDRLEALTWIFTFMSVVLIDIDIGLFCGIVMSVIALYLKGWKSYSSVLGVINDTGIYVDITTHKSAVKIPHTEIFRYYGCINFASRAGFKRKLYETIGVGEKEVRRASLHPHTEAIGLHGIETVILDMSCIPHIDYAACKIFSEIRCELKPLGLNFYLACPSDRVYDMVMHANAMGDGPFQTFPTVHDAVLVSQGKSEMV